MPRIVVVVALAILLASCGGVAPSVVEPDRPHNQGEGRIVVRIEPDARTMGMLSHTDQEREIFARIRISNDDTNYNLLRDIPLDDGAATLAAEMPAAPGYSVAAVTYHTIAGHTHTGLIGRASSTPDVMVQADAVTEVSMSPSPLVYTFDAPESAQAGELVTIRLTIPDPGIELWWDARLELNDDPWDTDAQINLPLHTELQQHGADYTATWTFHAPHSDGTKVLYYRASVHADTDAWSVTTGRPLHVRTVMPSVNDGPFPYIQIDAPPF